MDILSYHVRQVVGMSKEEVMSLPYGCFAIHYDDGVVETQTEQIQLTWFVYEFYRQFPKVPINKHVHAPMGILSKAALRNLKRNALFDCLNHPDGTVDTKVLSKLGYSVLNAIGNWIDDDLPEFISTTAPKDWYDITSNKAIKALRDNIEPTPEGIDKVNSGIIKILSDTHSFPNNPIAMAMQAKILRPGQVKNVFGALAYRTALSGRVFKKPITSNLLGGMSTIYDSLVESQSSARSDFFTQGLLGNTEYGRRKLNLVSGVIRRIHIGDCMEHLPVEQRGYFEEQVTDRDLWAMTGKYYLAEDGMEKMITRKDRQLIGRVVKLRVVHKCLNDDPYGACSKCYGYIARSLPKGINAGVLSSNHSEQNKSQTVMSIKHEDTAAKLTDLVFGENAARFFEYDGGTRIYLHPSLAGRKIKVTIPVYSGNGLTDLQKADNVDALHPNSISRIREVYVQVEHKGRLMDGEASLDISGSPCYFTMKALHHLKETGWDFDAKGNFTIDLSGWDVNVPLMEFPLTDRGLIEYLENITAKTIGAKDNADPHLRSLCMFDDYEAGLRSFFRLSNDRMKVHFSHCEIIAFALSVATNRAKNDFRPPLAGEAHTYAKYTQIMNSRSLAALYTYQGQDRSIVDVSSYTMPHRADHYLDSLIIPDDRATIYKQPF